LKTSLTIHVLRVLPIDTDHFVDERLVHAVKRHLAAAEIEQTPTNMSLDHALIPGRHDISDKSGTYAEFGTVRRPEPSPIAFNEFGGPPKIDILHSIVPAANPIYYINLAMPTFPAIVNAISSSSILPNLSILPSPRFCDEPQDGSSQAPRDLGPPKSRWRWRIGCV
jgi:hypothetical protein